MNNASTYQKKITKLLGKLPKTKVTVWPRGDQAVAVMIEAILQADSDPRAAKQAFETLKKEYVDFNELRISPLKDIVDRLGKEYPNAWAKAAEITTSLKKVFSRTYDVSIDYMADMTKKDLRRHLREVGLSPYAASYVTLNVFDGHAIPIDTDLLDVLKMEEYVDPESDLDEVQGFLERVIAHKDAIAAHHVFRSHVKKSVKAMEKYRHMRREAARQAEEAARKIREEKEAAEQKKKEEAEAKKALAEARKAEAEAKKALAEKEKKKAAKKAAAQKAAKKIAKKSPAQKAKKKSPKK